MMSTAVRNGANSIAYACGQLGSYISMSFEKWLIDEEVCRMLRRILAAMDITVESIDVDTIKNVGSDGNYLVHPLNQNICRVSFIGLPVMRIALWITTRVEEADHW